MLLEETVVVEPHDVVIVDVVAEVLVPHVLVGAIRRTTHPTHDVAESRVVPRRIEHHVVAAFVDHVRGDDHAVRQRQRRDEIHCPVRMEQTGEPERPHRQRVEAGAAVVQEPVGILEERISHVQGRLSDGKDRYAFCTLQRYVLLAYP